ncbi:MAG: DUF4129 domain-containing protein [Chloroflexi bacterium]|nr:DUF4129 domain-containing protein [Chloroflexota bacterium]
MATNATETAVMSEQSTALPTQVEDNEVALRYVTNRWSRRVVQPILIALFVSSLLAGVVIILSNFMAAREWVYLPFLGFVVALESVYTVLWLEHPNQRITDNVAYHAAEIVVIFLVTRLFTWFIAGNFPDITQFEAFLRSPLLLFTDQLFWFALFLNVLVWGRALSLSLVFSRLAIDVGEATYFLVPKNKRLEDQRPFLLNRIGIVGDFFRQWVAGGIVLAILATASTIDLPAFSISESIFSIARLGMPTEMLLTLLIYFVSGLLLLSQGRLAAANARWLRDGVTKSAKVERAWHRYSSRLLLIIAFVAALLPIGSTNAIGRILEAFISVLFSIATFLYLSLLGLFALFLPSQEPLEQTPITPQPMPTLAPSFPPAPEQPPNEVAKMIYSSAFWTIAIVIGVVAILFFLRERGVRINTTQLKTAWAQLKAWFKQAWQGITVQVTELRQSVQDRLRVERKEDGGEGGKRPFRFIRVNALPPREQIRYFYLSIVRRATEKGIERRQNETPLEYAQDLKEEFPDAELDVEALTDAFLKARYSPQPIVKDDVSPIKKRFKQIRSNIRRRRTSDPLE